MLSLFFEEKIKQIKDKNEQCCIETQIKLFNQKNC